MSNHDNLSRGNSILFGLAFDNKDDHKRITTGENFYILGGSVETHENLVEEVLKFNVVVKKYGKKLDELSETEFYTIAKEIRSESEKTYWFFHA
ncbi:MAG: hypothetical protein NG747_09770 [Candidatus Brocadia sp.]|nr:hypothetical protein [Candidatus Brocadia sp.]